MNIKLVSMANQNENYRRELEEYEEDIQKSTQAIEELKNEIKFKENHIKALRREASESNINKNEAVANEQLEDAKERNAKLAAALRKKNEEYEVYEEELEKLKEQFDSQIDKDKKEKEKLERQLERIANMNVRLLLLGEGVVVLTYEVE